MLRCSGIRTWDGARGLPGVSFDSPKCSRNWKPQCLKLKPTFASVLLYPTNVGKEKRESGPVWGHLWRGLPLPPVRTTQGLLTASRRGVFCIRKLSCIIFKDCNDIALLAA